MNVLLVLIPVTALVVLIGVLLFFWAVNHQQFDDLDSPGMLPLMDDEPSTVKPRVEEVTEETTRFDEAALARLVDCFYEKVRRDSELGPVFNAAVRDWDEHKRLLTSFWASVALHAGSYRGNPMAAHRPHPIRAAHFDRWLELWQQTCAEELDEAHAAQMLEYAERIGRSLKYGLGMHPQSRAFSVPIIGIQD